MKSLKKLFALLLTASALSFTFMACSDDDDDVKTVATYKNSDATEDEYELITLYSDNTFKMHVYKKASFAELFASDEEDEDETTEDASTDEETDTSEESIDFSGLSGLENFTIIMDLDAATGTYDGDISKDGKVNVTIKKMAEMKEPETEEELTEYISKITSVLASGKTTITFTNSDFPLVDYTGSHATDEFTVSENGKTVTDSEGNSYTRQ